MFALAACSKASTDKLVDNLSNFNRGVEAVDQSIAKVSTALYNNCTSLQTVAQAADDITGSCNKASGVVQAGNAVIKNFCQNSNVTNIASAVSATASSVSAAKSQLSAAKASCRS